MDDLSSAAEGSADDDPSPAAASSPHAPSAASPVARAHDLDELSDCSGVSSRCSIVSASDLSAPRIADIDAFAALSRRGSGLSEHHHAKRVSKSDRATRLGLTGKFRRRFMNLERKHGSKAAGVSNKLDKARCSLQSIGSAWNRNKLRVGDRLDPEREQRTQGRRAGRPHPKAWTIRGTIALSFARIGALSQRENRDTKRPLDAIAVTSLAATHHQSAALNIALHSLRYADGDPPRWVFVGRSSDCTPLRISFGALRELSHVARYWHKAKGDKTRLLYAAELRGKAQKLPAHGIVEMMAQTATIAWPKMHGNFCAVESHDLFYPPVFLERTNGSTLFTACLLYTSPSPRD